MENSSTVPDEKYPRRFAMDCTLWAEWAVLGTCLRRPRFLYYIDRLLLVCKSRLNVYIIT